MKKREAAIAPVEESNSLDLLHNNSKRFNDVTQTNEASQPPSSMQFHSHNSGNTAKYNNQKEKKKKNRQNSIETRKTILPPMQQNGSGMSSLSLFT